MRPRERMLEIPWDLPPSKLCERLTFPIKRVQWRPDLCAFTFVLGQPDTMERDITPLRAGQFVQLEHADATVPTLTCLLSRVGEGEVVISLGALNKAVMAEEEAHYADPPVRLIRPPQHLLVFTY